MVSDEDIELAVSLPHFDGPFDVLLALIRKNEYAMEDLPVSDITSQFLGYVKRTEAIEIELGSEFMETASWLVLLKSKSLLPREAAAEAQEELARVIQNHVLDRETLEQTKELLDERRSGRPRVSAAGAAKVRVIQESDEEPGPTAADLRKKAHRAMASRRAAASFSANEEPAATVAEQRRWVLEHLAHFPAGTPFSSDPWFAAQSSVGARASLFLALLELGRTGDLIVHQYKEYGPILVKRPRLASEFVQAEAERIAV